MRLRDAIDTWRVRFSDADIKTADLDARLLALHVAGFSYADFIADPLLEMTRDQAATFEQLATKRLARTPLAHLTGEREFWSLPFVVSDATLIPRPDSETLIEASLDHVDSSTRALEVLDLGTGSGCLLLSLLHEWPRAHGLGIDRSCAALQIARHNSLRLGLQDRCLFVAGDWGQAIDHQFDLIVCNPPYIVDSDGPTLAPEVRDHEPKTALFGGPDGLEPLRHLLPCLRGLLSPIGFYVMECGAGQAENACNLISLAGLEIVEIRADLAGNERAIVAKAA